MPTKLKGLTINRVDLVDKGANPDAHIMLFKRDQAHAESEQEGEVSVTKQDETSAASIFQSLAKALGFSVDKAAKKPPADDAAAEVAESSEEEQEGEIDPPAKKKDMKEEQPMTTTAKAAEAVPDDIQKRLDEQESKIAAITKRAEDAEAIAKAERDKTETREYVAKAEALPYLPVAATEVGAILKRVNAVDPELAGQVEGLLKSMGEAVKTGKIFEEVGKSGSTGGTSAFAQIQEIAKSKVEKGTAKTLADGISKAAEENPELYKQYRNER